MKHKIILLLTALLLTLSTAQCGKPSKQLDYGFTSREALIRTTSTLISKGALAEAGLFTLTQKEFHELIYPNLPEKGISEVDYWFMVAKDTQRGLSAAVDDFRGWHLLTIGKPEKIKKYGALTVYMRTPVTFSENPDGSGKKKTSEKIFTAIVEYNGLFRFWNSTYE